MQVLYNSDTKYIHSISNHPVHIVDDKNLSSPSAFIPFCSFGGNIAIMGTKIPSFRNPVCNKFKPTLLEGRLCYQVDVNEFMNQVDSKKLRTHGLIFLMDYNEDMLGIEAKNPLKNVLEKDLGDMQDKEDSKDEAMIYIETLGMLNYKY